MLSKKGKKPADFSGLFIVNYFVNLRVFRSEFRTQEFSSGDARNNQSQLRLRTPATVPGPRGLTCIHLSGLSFFGLQRTPDSGTKGSGASSTHARPPFPGSLIVRLIRTPVVCEEKWCKWLATRREEQCLENTPER
jgi:hypothetical protein